MITFKHLFLTLFCCVSFFYSNAQCNKAIQLDGTNDFMHTDFANYTYSAITMELWVVSASNQNAHYISMHQNAFLALGNWNSAAHSINYAKGLSPYNISTTDISSSSNWHHIAYVYDGTNQYLYVDGVLNATLSTTGSVSQNSTYIEGLVIGARFDQVQQFFGGKVDEIRIWNVARTAQEIADNMNSELEGTQTGLLAYYKFDEGAGSTVADHSGNGHHLSMNNMDVNTVWVDGPSSLKPTMNLNVSIDGAMLTAEATDVTYQWLDCDNGNAIIEGATSASYNALVSGNYAVQITDGDCVDTSSCTMATVLSLTDEDFTDVFTVSPNPSSDHFTFTFKNGIVNEVEMVIYNTRGQVVYKTSASNVEEIQVDCIRNAGLYLAVLYIDNKKVTYKLHKQ